MKTCPKDVSKKLTKVDELPPEEVIFLQRTSFGIAPQYFNGASDIGDLARFNAGGTNMNQKVEAWLVEQFRFPTPRRIKGIKDPTGFITLGLSEARIGPKNLRNIKYELEFIDNLDRNKNNIFRNVGLGTFVCKNNIDIAIHPDCPKVKYPHPGWTTLGYSSSQELAYRKCAEQKSQTGKEAALITFQRAMYSKFQLFERLTMFWKDHFNLGGDLPSVQPYLSSWDTLTRQHVTGNFYKMLLATAHHPAMLTYLDNHVNATGNPNENYAREVIELHTLGAMNYHGVADPSTVDRISTVVGPSVQKGYVDADVYEAAEMLAGWHTERGSFKYNSQDAGMDEVTVLGHTFSANGGSTGDVYREGVYDNDDGSPVPGRERQGRFLLRMLATHPGTAKHIAYKLVKHFVSDTPPESLVNKVRDAFLMHVDSDDQLEKCYLTLFKDPLMYSRDSWGEKVLRPYEMVTKAFRVMGCQKDFYHGSKHGGFITSFWGIRKTSHFLHGWTPPDGYPQDSEYWINTAAITSTWTQIDKQTKYGQGGCQEILSMMLSRFGTLNGAELTPRNIVHFWAKNVWGFLPSDKALEPVLDFFISPTDNNLADSSQTVGKDDPIVGGFETNNIRHRWKFKLRVMILLLIKHPYAMLR